MMDQVRTAKETLLENALRESVAGGGTGAVDLDILLGLMKQASREPALQPLSCLYFAGAFDDHRYFLHNRAVAIGLAVLPEDSEKAGQRKAHPHQQEIMVVLRGRLRVELEGESLEKVAGDVLVIDPGRCHRVLPINDEDAAYLFIKTWPAREPREVDCP
jgi:mannose-6-phosphate isomerase-like protein (cupin superfamily)